MNIIDWALEQATSFLPPLGNRWLHVQGVVARARETGQIFDEDEKACLIATAYLHDIGYAPTLHKTGFHPIDGAYYLRSHGQERLASLVAYHSEAQFEAQLRGLGAELAVFPREQSAVADVLTYCDLTTGPTGELVSLQERIDDILSRYDREDIVVQAMYQAMPAWAKIVRRIQRCLKERGLEM
jgi:hypothetical protein